MPLQVQLFLVIVALSDFYLLYEPNVTDLILDLRWPLENHTNETKWDINALTSLTNLL